MQSELAELKQNLTDLVNENLGSIKQVLVQQHEHHTDRFDKIYEALGALEQSEPEKKQPGLPHVQTPSFSGDGDDPLTFLKDFDLYTKFHGWDEDKTILLFSLSLRGPAKQWILQLEPGSYKSLKELIDLFSTRFLCQTDNFRLRQELNMRKQLDNESVTSFANDITSRCQRLNLSKEEKLNYFLLGLKRNLQNFVVLQQPKTFDEAVQLAKLKSSIKAEPTFTTGDVLAIQKGLMEEINRKSSPKAQVAAVNQNPNFEQRNFPNNNQRLDIQIRRVIREELAKAPRDVRGFSNRPGMQTNRGQNNRGDFYGLRSQRTTMGFVICHSCGRVGHYARNCFARSRDARGFTNSQDARGFRDSHDARGFRDSRDARGVNDARDTRIPSQGDRMNRTAVRSQQRQGNF